MRTYTQLTLNQRYQISAGLKNLVSQNKIAELIYALGRRASTLHTNTSDNGSEFAEHERIANALGINFYFAHPYSSAATICCLGRRADGLVLAISLFLTPAQ